MVFFLQPLLLLLLLLLLQLVSYGETKSTDTTPAPHTHTSNYAIIVSTSRYYFNYRHSANALSIYNLLKTRGKFPDSHIILMLAHDYTIDARNPFKNTLYTEAGRNTYESFNDITKNKSPHTSIEVDYSGDDVNVESFARVLLGRHPDGELPSRKLPPLNNSSNIFIYMTGHGGDTFLKFHDMEEISSLDFYSIFQQMHIMKRYHSILFVTDTCQAFTLSNDLYNGNENDDGIPSENSYFPSNILSIGSALKDENSYAHHSDHILAISVIDRFSHHFTSFLKKHWDKNWNHISFKNLINSSSLGWNNLRSHVGIRGKVDGRDIGDIKLSEFLENIALIKDHSNKDHDNKKGAQTNRKGKENNLIVKGQGRIMKWDEQVDLKISTDDDTKVTTDTTSNTITTCEDTDHNELVLQKEQAFSNNEDMLENEADITSSSNYIPWNDIQLLGVIGLFVLTVHVSSKYW